MIWDEARIRDEMKRLDEKTGLNGAALPILFNNSKVTLGCFYFIGDQARKFEFSNHYFQDPDFPTEEALDIIRHEYAHYMDQVLYGNSGHSITRKQGCTQIGAAPLRIFHHDRIDYWNKKHEKERHENHRIDQLAPGTVLRHSYFGHGTVLSTKGEGLHRVLQIDFPKVGQKTLGASWVLEHCLIGDDRR